MPTNKDSSTALPVESSCVGRKTAHKLDTLLPGEHSLSFSTLETAILNATGVMSAGEALMWSILYTWKTDTDGQS